MDLRRWLWIPLVLQTLVWSMFFIFGFFGFAETYTNAPEDWWIAHQQAYWILLLVGFGCLPAYHLIAWLARVADRYACSKLGTLRPYAPLWQRSLEHVGGMMVWGIWLACLVTLFGHLELPLPWPDYGGALLNFTPVELTFWACACGLATLTVLGLKDQMHPKHADVGLRAMLLHLACYIWFYLSYGGIEANLSDHAWMLALLSCAMALPMARLIDTEPVEPALPSKTEKP